ncbi:MAG: hypothetical protein HY961_04445 [Ignavibacteriae bacterium]|nr:hypothetical protein [Ignavibacteriota bacterium]
MPDTICHSVQGGLMVALPFLSRIKRRAWLWSLVGLGAFMGALPDLIGAHGNLIERDNWREYRVAHFGEISEVLKFVPMYGLHLYMDSLTHSVGHRWWKWNERLWLEASLWAINVLLIAWLVRTWRRIEVLRTERLQSG